MSQKALGGVKNEKPGHRGTLGERPVDPPIPDSQPTAPPHPTFVPISLQKSVGVEGEQ